jgi:dipeptidyl aminopeptidase/acylaminoacyl peptidase
MTVSKPRLQPLDLFGIEMPLSVAASPDSATVAYIATQADAMADAFVQSLWLVDRSSLASHRVALPGQPLMCRWMQDGALAVVVQGAEGAQLLRLAADGETGLLATLPATPSALALSRDGRQVALRMNVAEPALRIALPERPAGAKPHEAAFYTERVDWRVDGVGVLDGYEQVFHLELASGALTQLTHGVTPSGYFAEGLAFSDDGASILFVSSLRPDWHKTSFHTDIYSVHCATREIACLTTRFGVDIDPRFSPSGEWIAYRGFDDVGQFHGCPNLYLMRPDGSEARCLADVGQGIGAHVWADDGAGVYFTYVRDAAHRLAFVALDGTVSELACGLAQAGALELEPYLVASAPLSAVPGGVVSVVCTAHDPGQLAEISRAGAQRLLTRLNRHLGGLALGACESVSYTSSDGTPLQAWVTYPPGHDPARPCPLILQIHGGPSASYGGNFSYRFQRYAAEGFIVVAPNYRGSLGTDMGFYHQPEHWVFPGLEYDDVMAAVDAVAARVAVDPARLHVTGQSAGGLMSAWVIGKTSRFAAAVVTAPLINYISHFLTHDLCAAYVGRYFAAQPWEDFAGHWARSPLSLVGNVTTPTLIIQGDRDSRTPLSEGLQLYHALKLRDVPAALLILPGSFHVTTRPMQLVEEHQHMQRWFQTHAKSPDQQQP